MRPLRTDNDAERPGCDCPDCNGRPKVKVGFRNGEQVWQCASRRSRINATTTQRFAKRRYARNKANERDLELMHRLLGRLTNRLEGGTAWS